MKKVDLWLFHAHENNPSEMKEVKFQFKSFELLTQCLSKHYIVNVILTLGRTLNDFATEVQ